MRVHFRLTQMPPKLCSIQRSLDTASFLVSFLIGIGLHCLVANSLSRALHHLSPINSRKTSSSFALGVDRTPTHNTNLCSTVCSQARNASHALGSSQTDCSVIFVRLNRICHLVLHMSHPLLFSHLPFTTSTSSSSFTLPSPTTQEHAAQSVQNGHLQEHPAHHAHLHALPVDKQRHQESLWRENLQSGGNPRTTTATGYELKELATVSRTKASSGDPYQLYDAQENLRN